MFNVIQSIALLMGTMIGAGVLGLPYVFARAGVGVGLVHLGILGTLTVILHLMLGEVVVRTRRPFELPGLARRYLGHSGKLAMSILFFLGAYSAFVAYLVGEGAVLSELFGGSQFLWGIAVWGIVATFVFLGLRAVRHVEVAMVSAVAIILTGIAIASAIKGDPSRLPVIDLRQLFLPFGVVLFALGGASAIPPMEELLPRKEKILRRAIIIGTIIPIILYAAFAVFAVSVTGMETTEVATVGLGRILGPALGIAGNLFAALAMLMAFISIGLAVKRAFVWDFKMSRNLATLAVMAPPLILFLGGAQSFIRAMGIAGALLGGLQGLLLVAIFLRARRRGDVAPKSFILPAPRILAFMVATVFFAGSILGLQQLLFK